MEKYNEICFNVEEAEWVVRSSLDRVEWVESRLGTLCCVLKHGTILYNEAQVFTTKDKKQYCSEYKDRDRKVKQ